VADRRPEHGKFPSDFLETTMKDDRALASTAGDCAMGGEGALRDTAGVNAQTDELPHPRGVYVDTAVWHWQGLKWAHLLADDIDELHRFAARLGIHRASYQGPPRTSVPHYDLTPYERHRAIALGAIACSREEIVAIVRRTRWPARERDTAALRSTKR
jgi:hypothetical protein